MSGASEQRAGSASEADPDAVRGPDVPLSQLLVAVGEPLVDVLAAPRGFDVAVRDVVIVDPDESQGTREGDVVLVIGARGRAAVPLVRAAADSGASVVAVKVDNSSASGVRDTTLLRDTARDHGIALLGVGPDVRWERLEAFARAAVGNALATTGPDDSDAPGDLFSLAQTVAAMTEGIVTIEDTAARVLAYSRTDDEVDELRRLSILGRRGPESYLEKLREWGVYERLRAGDDVIEVDERPELGIRRRMAVGIHAGDQPLGVIWVQEGRFALSERVERALLGAARVAALQLIRQRTETGGVPRFRENLLTGLLDGRVDAASVAGDIGAHAARPCAVVAFTLRPSGSGDPDRSEIELLRSEMIGLISVHAAAYRRSALVTTIGSRVYVLLPDLPARASGSPVVGWTREMVDAAGQHLRSRVKAGVGSPVETLEHAAASRTEADRILDVLDDETIVATIADVRSQVLVGEVLGLLRSHERIRDPRVRVLVAHDDEHGTDLGASLLAFLEAFGDVRHASERLRVHPNTVRHRVRRAGEVGDLDLADPTERLSLHLQLRLALPR